MHAQMYVPTYHEKYNSCTYICKCVHAYIHTYMCVYVCMFMMHAHTPTMLKSKVTINSDSQPYIVSHPIWMF